jgi:hypothetical protein
MPLIPGINGRFFLAFHLLPPNTHQLYILIHFKHIVFILQKHGVGSNQFLSVNIGVIRLLSVITTTSSIKNNIGLINIGPSFRH